MACIDDHGRHHPLRKALVIAAWIFAIPVGTGCELEPGPAVRAPTQARSIAGQVRVDDGTSSGGAALAGVSVWVGRQQTRTDADGFWSLGHVETANGRAVVRFERDGYAPYSQTIHIGDNDAFMTTHMASVAIQERVRIAEGAVLTADPDGRGRLEASLVLPPGFAEFEGNEVDVSVSLVRPQIEEELKRFPGDFLGRDDSIEGGRDLLETFGTVNVSFRDGDDMVDGVDLTEPVTMQLRLDPEVAANYNAGDEIETWWLDQEAGDWVREGAARVIVQDGEKYAEWEVDHFTWWNVDRPLGEHACVQVQISAATTDDAELLRQMEVVLDGADYSGQSLPQPFNGQGKAVVTGWRGHPVRLALRPRGAVFGGIGLPLVPESAAEGDVGRGEFHLPDTVGSGVFDQGPNGGELDPDAHCLQVQREIGLKKGTVEGVVRDESGAPVTELVVSIPELGLSTRPNRAGHYVFAQVPWLEQGDLTLTVQGTTPAGRPDLRITAQTVRRNAAHHEVDLIASPYARPPWFVRESLSASETGVGRDVIVEFAAMDDDDTFDWTLTPSAGRMRDIKASVAAEGDLHRGSVRATWEAPAGEGLENLEVEVRDAEGSRSSAELSVRWTDRPPVLRVSGPTHADVGESIDLHASAVDPEGAEVSYTWAVDGDTVAGPGSTSVLHLDLRDSGALIVQVQAGDGRHTVSQNHTILVAEVDEDSGFGPDDDTTPPETRIDAAPAASVSETTAVLSFSSADADAVGFECYLNAPPFSPCTSPVAVGPLGAGSHTFVVAAVDAAGNVDPTPAFATWDVDLTSPWVQIDAAPDVVTSSPTQDIAFSGSDDVGLTGFECRIDGGSWDPCSSPYRAYGLANGEHAFQVRSLDAAGWRSAPVSVTWRTELVDGPWHRFRGNRQGTGLSRADAPSATGMLAWSLATTGAMFASPAIGYDGTIYLGSFYGDPESGCQGTNVSGRFLAVDPGGSLAWELPLAVVSSPAVGGDGTIYVGSFDGKLYAIAPTGAVSWSFATTAGIVSSPLVHPDGTIIFAGGDSTLHALDPDGSDRWQIPDIVNTQGPIGMGCSTPLSPSPALSPDGQTVYIGDVGPRFSAVALTGTVRWTFMHPGIPNMPGGFIGWSSAAVGDSGDVYATAADGLLYSLASTGSLNWTYDPSVDFADPEIAELLISSPAIDADGAILATVSNLGEDGALFAVDPAGQQIWQAPITDAAWSSPSIAADGTIYLGTSGGLRAFSPSGTEQWTLGMHNIWGSSPAIGADGRIYVGTYNSGLLAVD